ncbi:hypothetical protein D9619_002150 [Psilocybe cf. subviscida]|uniref:Uncharacterized protein n=1 Tax=Psilocybe cf. subviscida TaxID=2480587 RepID=A0A8H5BCJ4_9AGAR|nr:hypothetical protein D9619_002150 [Psilocybe cf. subviscida]
MDSPFAKLERAVNQAAEFRQTLEDDIQDFQRLTESYQGILQERQALREANRALMSSVLYLRGHVQDLEARLSKLESSCSYSNSRSTKSQHYRSEREDEDARRLDYQLDGKDPEEMKQKIDHPPAHGLLAGQQLGHLTWIEAKNLEKNLAHHDIRTFVARDIPTKITVLPEPVPDSRVHSLASSVQKEPAFDARQLWSARSSLICLFDAPTQQYSNYTRDARCSNQHEIDWPTRQIGQTPSTSSEGDGFLRETD